MKSKTRMALEPKFGGHIWPSLPCWLSLCEYHTGSVIYILPANGNCFRGKFLAALLHSGSFYIVDNSVRLITYGCWGYGAALSGELGQLRLIIGMLTGAHGAHGYYGFRRRGSSVR